MAVSFSIIGSCSIGALLFEVLSSADVGRLAEGSVLGPTAIIVETDVGHGMLRMLELLVEDVCAVRPFRREPEAEKWLGEFSGDAT
jgi:hypothetical protein